MQQGEIHSIIDPTHRLDRTIESSESGRARVAYQGAERTLRRNAFIPLLILALLSGCQSGTSTPSDPPSSKVAPNITHQPKDLEDQLSRAYSYDLRSHAQRNIESIDLQSGAFVSTTPVTPGVISNEVLYGILGASMASTPPESQTDDPPSDCGIVAAWYSWRQLQQESNMGLNTHLPYSASISVASTMDDQRLLTPFDGYYSLQQFVMAQTRAYSTPTDAAQIQPLPIHSDDLDDLYLDPADGIETIDMFTPHAPLQSNAPPETAQMTGKTIPIGQDPRFPETAAPSFSCIGIPPAGERDAPRP